MKYILSTLSLLTSFFFSYVSPAFSQDAQPSEAHDTNDALVTLAGKILTPLSEVLDAVLFYPVPIPFVEGDKGFPFLVLWLVIGSIFLTIRMGFINIRLFGHAIQIMRGTYSNENDPGEVSHTKALYAAVSGTVGLGNIAGVAVAVSLGGPGAVLWMVIGGLFGMTSKFTEVTLGLKYRKIDENGRISGGAFHYLRDGLAELNMPRLGKVLAVIFTFCCLAGALGGGNMFQANQTVAIINDTISFGEYKWIIPLVLAILVGVILWGGITRIANVAGAIVPFMILLYVGSCLTILLMNIDSLGEAFAIILRDAFTGAAVGGGMVGAVIQGFRRSSFSNEAGIGSAPIAHSAAKTTEPVREGCIALLEPFIDTVIICFMTGLIITVTGVYNNDGTRDGVLLTSLAFSTVNSWFPVILAVVVPLFAFSTMITWGYYGERCWKELFGTRVHWLYYLIFCTVTFVGGVATLDIVINLADLLFLSAAIPNMIGLYLLSNNVKQELNQYIAALKAGKFIQRQKG